MRWIRWSGAASAALVVALLASSAQAAHPDVRLTVNRHALHSGQQLVASARAQEVCSWNLSWAGQKQTGRGTSLTATFTAPPVTRPTRIPVRARCFRDEHATAPRATAAPREGTAQRLTVAVPAAPDAVEVVTVLPSGSATLPPTSGGLPSTGGPWRWLVLAGLGAVLVGTTCARVARRRPGDGRSPSG